MTHPALFLNLLILSFYSQAAAAKCKIYRGEYGYDVAGRPDGKKIYRGEYGYDVAGRIDVLKIYRGEYGYDVAFRVDGQKIYRGAYGYDVFRIDGVAPMDTKSQPEMTAARPRSLRWQQVI